MKTFPILKSCVDRCREQGFHSPLVVPYELVERHEKQARVNHGQSVERLAQRGGLSWLELLLVITDHEWGDHYGRRMREVSEGDVFRTVAITLMHEFSAAYSPKKP